MKNNDNGNRGNCFDLIRHFAALLVLYSHHYPMLKRPEPSIRHWESYGFIAVAIFFSISGYFMPASFVRSGNFLNFIGRRLKRLLPALVVCSFIITYVIGTIFTSTPTWEYLTSRWTLGTFASWATFLGRSIPGVFSNFLMPNAIDGSLWTLPIELLCYVVIGTALSFSQSWKMALFLFVAAVLGTAWVVHVDTSFNFYSVPLNFFLIFGICFSGGSLLAMTKDAWFSARIPLLIFAILSIWLMRGRVEINIFGMLGITLITVIIGESAKDKFIKGKFDISYGIYIYAFPIQQLVINEITHRLWLGMLISLVFTLVAGYLSYQFVEKRFLHKNNY
jgi:peptidoglycan/LPS O-acetylase OafA/YrhL